MISEGNSWLKIQSAAADPPSTSWWDFTNAFSLFGEQQEDDEDEDANDDKDVWNLKARRLGKESKDSGEDAQLWADGNLLLMTSTQGIFAPQMIFLIYK